jgi:peptidoglycan/LPS O-acetylase OafA/YrhL
MVADNKYRPELDVVRFIAFSLVFLFHCFSFLTENASNWKKMGSFGLCLFFTLSAYLITDLLFQERQRTGSVSVKNFYIRRVLRIWPLYFVGIGAGMLLTNVTHRASDVVGFIWYLLFSGNIYCAMFGWPGNPMSPLWSISIEEQFYAIWPWVARKFSKTGMIVVSLVLILVANVTLFVFGRIHAIDRVVWTNTLVQFEMFGVGILLALFKNKYVTRNLLAGCGLILFGPVLWFAASIQLNIKQPSPVVADSWTLMGAYALITLGCAAILQGWCVLGPSRAPKWMAYFGRRSYGMYVFHLACVEFARLCVDPLLGGFHLAMFILLAFVLTSATAIISYEFFESPFLRLKKRFAAPAEVPVAFCTS